MKHSTAAARLRLALMLTAVHLLMVLAVLPHHHPGVWACLDMEVCRADGAVNDAHTAHHQRGNDSGCALQQLHNAVAGKGTPQIASAHKQQRHDYAPAAAVAPPMATLCPMVEHEYALCPLAKPRQAACAALPALRAPPSRG